VNRDPSRGKKRRLGASSFAQGSPLHLARSASAAALRDGVEVLTPSVAIEQHSTQYPPGGIYLKVNDR